MTTDILNSRIQGTDALPAPHKTIKAIVSSCPEFYSGNDREFRAHFDSKPSDIFNKQFTAPGNGQRVITSASKPGCGQNEYRTCYQ